MRRTRQLGRYHLTYRIAYGGMAELFRAFTYDRQGNKHDVAIKQLLPHFHKDREFVDMLTDEFKLVSCIDHTNVARVYELVEFSNATLIAMEFVDGKDLRSAIERGKELHKQLALDDAAYIVARSLEGLHHAHLARDKAGTALSIVHRDYSPANVLIGYDGSVKLCDFGVAKAASNRIQTKTGIIKGKVRYMSPEQAFGRKLDARSDVFSVGAVLYELVTGQPAFSAPNDVELIFAVRDAKPAPVDTLYPNAPRNLIRIIERAMARDVEARFQSALEFRDELVAFLRDFSPGYRRTRLSSWMKRLFEHEIEDELRAMEEFVAEVADGPVELGRNLLEDVQDENAPQRAWLPVQVASRAKPPPAELGPAAQRALAPPPLPPSARKPRMSTPDRPAIVASSTVIDEDLDGAPTKIAERQASPPGTQLFDSVDDANTDVMPRAEPPTRSYPRPEESGSAMAGESTAKDAPKLRSLPPRKKLES